MRAKEETPISGSQRRVWRGIAAALRKRGVLTTGFETLAGYSKQTAVNHVLSQAKKLGFGITHYGFLWSIAFERNREDCADLHEFIALHNLTARHKQRVQALEKPESNNEVLQVRTERLIDRWIQGSLVIRDRNSKIRAPILEKLVIQALNAPDSTETRRIIRRVLRARRIPNAIHGHYRVYVGARLNPPTSPPA